MKKTVFILSLVYCASLTAGFAAPLDVTGQDDANQEEYKSGWNSGKNGGNGFGKWNLQTQTSGGDQSHAGFFVADTSAKPDLNGIATSGKAFGFYANGVDFESAAAFRPFDRPLQVGQSFSFQMEHGQFVKKFDTDSSQPGSCGVTLLSKTDLTRAEDYNLGARFEFGYSQADSAYVVSDGDGTKKLDVPFTDAGLSVTFTLVTADTYTLEVTVLSSRQTYHVEKRTLGGTAGDTLGGFCLFDRNGETNDVFFNGFQILQKP